MPDDALTRERPILFSAPMVRAILNGTKTQTRRVVRFRACNDDHTLHRPWLADSGWHDYDDALRCPYGAPGDRLWVRETFDASYEYPSDENGSWITPWHQVPRAWRTAPNLASVYYRADASEYEAIYLDEQGVALTRVKDARDDPGMVEGQRWAPAIHMPHWASRITLEVTGVRVERLQDISTADAWAEGIPSSPDVDPVHEYRELWDSLNAKRGHGWDANPWVWVVNFRRVADA